jgi:hypothetical protein
VEVVVSDAAFSPFPKMGRLTRTCVITEKIDGTNAQVNIVPKSLVSLAEDVSAVVAESADSFMFAGSRTRYITPGENTDNAGFAAWVQEHADELFELGPGRHFGEWWGSKIQCGYGLTEKRFSLFNTSRWTDRHFIPTSDGLTYIGEGEVGSMPGEGKQWAPRCCYVVPVLHEGLFSERVVDNMLALLKHQGSVAAPGFMQPEGIVIYHVPTGVSFKKTLVRDESPKTAQPKPTYSADSEWARSET